jgi:hypothetical protein
MAGRVASAARRSAGDVERINAPFLAAGGTGDDFRAGRSSQHAQVRWQHLSHGLPMRSEDQSPYQAGILRRLDLLGLRRTRRESRRRAKLGVKRPLHSGAGRPLSLRHRHQTPQPNSRNHTSSRARRRTNFPQLKPAASISATHSAQTATATPPGRRTFAPSGLQAFICFAPSFHILIRPTASASRDQRAPCFFGSLR